MTYFGVLVINGISLGFIYALITLGFVMIFQSTGVVNFAIGSMSLFGAYIVAVLHKTTGFVPALVLGVVAGAVLAFLVERLLVSRARHADLSTLVILTLGVDLVLAIELTRRIGRDVLSFGDPWGTSTAALGPFIVPQARIAALFLAVAFVALFFAAIKYTNWGIATRANTEDLEAAALMGVSRGRVSLIAWMVAGALATFGGVFLGMAPSPGLTATANVTALNALPAAVVGGLDSAGGAVAGGVIIGIVQSLAVGYNSELTFLGSPLGNVATYGVMLLVLLWRPSGLFGAREVARV